MSGTKVALLASSRCPGTVIVGGLALARALRDAPFVVISGFHSPVEAECLAVLLRGRASLVVCPARSAINMRIPASWKGPVTDGRLTIRSFVDEVANAERGSIADASKRPRRPTTHLAERRNSFVASIADAVLFLHASPGGKLERLAHELFAAGKPVWTLNDPANENLLAQGAFPLLPDASALMAALSGAVAVRA